MEKSSTKSIIKEGGKRSKSQSRRIINLTKIERKDVKQAYEEYEIATKN